jgi:Fe-S-cluster containining protein
MSVSTLLHSGDSLPLTCSRSGTCCHGNSVMLNPWELAHLAEAKAMSPREFRDAYCEFGGIRLRFDGAPGWKGLPACSQYDPQSGCTVHGGRPLACRLYPLGRQKKGDALHYIHHGKEFPCLEGCPEVVDLPHMTVADYIQGQGAGAYELAQDEYLGLVQDIADGAFALLLDSGLAESGDVEPLRLWKEMGGEEPDALAARIGPEWMDRLMLPDLLGDLKEGLKDPAPFARLHYQQLQDKAQERFGQLENLSEHAEACALMMALALHLGRSLGAEPAQLAEHWVSVAREHGAQF